MSKSIKSLKGSVYSVLCSVSNEPGPYPVILVKGYFGKRPLAKIGEKILTMLKLGKIIKHNWSKIYPKIWSRIYPKS